MTLLDANDLQGSNEVGEDTWELFESIEQSFGVDLGDYHDLAGISILELSQRIDGLAKFPAEDSCLSSVAFNRLRRTFQNVTKTPRSSVRPATRLQNLLPWRTRHLQWASLQSDLGLELPRLNLPSWLLILCLILPVSLLIYARFFMGVRISGGVITICSIVLTLLALRAAMLYPARVIPASIETVGGLAKAVIARNYKTFAGAHGSSPERGVLPALRLLVAMQTGVNIEKVPRDTHPVRPQHLLSGWPECCCHWVVRSSFAVGRSSYALKHEPNESLDRLRQDC